MDEKKKVLLVFAMLAIVAIVGLILLFRSEKTGEFNVQLPVNIRPAKTTKPALVRHVPVESRNPNEDDAAQMIMKTKSSYIGNSCLWADTGMMFHISKGAIRHMDFTRDQVGKYDYFSKSDLEFNTLPDFYFSDNIYVKGGTVETYDVGARLCIKTYKGQKILPQAGLACTQNQWWLVGSICPLGVPSEAPPMPD